jgi:thiol-disulfide isomerase/thioredoxin
MASKMSKKTWIIVAILIIAVGTIAGIVLSCNSSDPSDSTSQTDEGLNFTLLTMAGTNITLSELRGMPVVLNFWSIGCTYCRQQLPYLENVAQASGGVIEVIAANVVDSATSVQSFFGDYEPAMIVALDEDSKVFVEYCQEYDNLRGSIPFTFFIDSEGLVQYKRLGAFQSETELWNTLHDVFGITIPETS